MPEENARLSSKVTEQDTTATMVEHWTAAEAVRNIEGGTLCKGIHVAYNLLEEAEE